MYLGKSFLINLGSSKLNTLLGGKLTNENTVAEYKDNTSEYEDNTSEYEDNITEYEDNIEEDKQSEDSGLEEIRKTVLLNDIVKSEKLKRRTRDLV